MGNEITRREFDELNSEVSELTRSVSVFVEHSSRYIDVLLASVTGQVPQGSIPIESHNRIVRYVITAFSVILVISIGATKLLPYVLRN